MLHNLRLALWPLAAIAAWPVAAAAQDSATLTLARAHATARSVSPELSAARAAVDAARARERQAGAFMNPVLAFERERTGDGAQVNSQNILSLDQTVEAPGVRGARRSAAQSRRALAEARLRLAEAQLDHDVSRAYAQAWSAGRRAALADEAFRAFSGALAVSERRLKEGDISGFAARRIRLESARYAALRAEAMLASRAARLALSALVAPSADSVVLLPGSLGDAGVIGTSDVATDSLVRVAMRWRADLAVSAFEVDVASAEARLASRERLPALTLIAGPKSEEIAGGARHSGFVVGLSVPVPLWDRRAGAVGAALAEQRQREAALAAMRRRVFREVAEAADALRTAQEQLDVLGPALQADAAGALRSAQLAYAEGELTLLEWLDTVRAYHETATAIANLRADLLVRAATLERAVGAPLFMELR